MLTVKEIVEKLRTEEQGSPWINELNKDERTGVKNALARWQKKIAQKKLLEQNHMDKIHFDNSYAPFEGALVAGVDEAGRGPLAGPVVTATVILPVETTTIIGLDDSKAVSKKERERLANEIRRIAIAYCVHIQSVEKIDEMNIYVATRDSMEHAVRGLSIEPDFVIADAMALDLNCQTASVVKADAKSLAVAAASILAKTVRDGLMEGLHTEYPFYNFKQNAGYGTAEHLQALKQYGFCQHHRKSFEPIKSMSERGGS